ncbi:MAG: sugar phosphate nucleotidyltransferase [Eubacterium sp.]
MVSSKTSTLGIIFPNTYDALVPELVSERLMASIPFASRYRMIDFILSSMVNSGIDNVSVLPREKYHSLISHLGAGREWDLTRKTGGLTIWPPYAEEIHERLQRAYSGAGGYYRIPKGKKKNYVVMTDCNIAVNFDFKDFVKFHMDNQADVTIPYTEQELPASAINATNMKKGMYYTFDIEGNRVTNLYLNSKEEGSQNFGMNIYCFEREYLINLVNDAFIHGAVYLERDVLSKRLDEMKVCAYLYDGYYARISDIKSYFNENMKLLDDKNLDALFEGGQIYTKLRDDNPTRYISGAAVKNTDGGRRMCH